MGRRDTYKFHNAPPKNRGRRRLLPKKRRSAPQANPDKQAAPRRRGGAMTLIDGIMLVVTIASAALLICAYFAGSVNPNKAWFFAMAGLIAPVLYIANIVLSLYWIVRWRLYALIPAIVLLIGYSNISLFFRPSLSKANTEVATKATKVVSYNVMGFLTENSPGRTVSSLDRISEFIAQTAPDILCLQEFQSKDARTKELIDDLLDMPYSRVNYAVPNSNGGGWGLAIYSRYPIIASGNMIFENSTNSMLWADIVIRPDTVRVFNNHLQTTSVSSNERDYLQNHEFLRDDSTREEQVRRIASKLRRNYLIRATQADSIAPLIKDSPYNVIVCGDFNDTPMSYVYSTIRGDLADSFAEKGKGLTANTYKGLFNLFRIDYILHSRELEATSYDTPAADYSDHKPVVAGFILPGAR